jgi:predicted Rossmann fold flavoprotein
LDVIVIGAGAAGMMCAAQAGQRGRRVLLIEHYRKLGEKIRISGGGRCNFTNLHCAPENYLSQNPHFCQSALARYTAQDFVTLVKRYGITYHEKTLGQLFCDGSSQQIIDMLKSECDRGGVQWRMPCSVREVRHVDKTFVVTTDQDTFRASSLVVATGGLSVPKIGAGPFGYRLAEQFGLPVVAPHPALVPLSLAPETLERFGDLSGISMDAIVSCSGGRFREKLLLTHRGLSGPAILQISTYWRGGDFIEIDLLPDHGAASWLLSEQSSRTKLDNLLAQFLPRRFAQQWCAAHDCARPLNQFSHTALKTLGHGLNHWRVRGLGQDRRRHPRYSRV